MTPPCSGLTDFFFPENPSGRQLEPLRAICRTCPYNQWRACLEGAVLRREEHGVWAGTSRDERRELSRLWEKPVDWTIMASLRSRARAESAALRRELVAA